MIAAQLISADGGMLLHPLEIFAAVVIGLGLLACARIETREYREIARRRKERGTQKAEPEIWTPDGGDTL